MKTIAQQLNVKDFPFIINDKDGNKIYFEDSDNFWVKSEFDKDGNEIYYEDSGNFWVKREFDKDGNIIYYKNSIGKIVDNRKKKIVLGGIEIELCLESFEALKKSLL